MSFSACSNWVGFILTGNHHLRTKIAGRDGLAILTAVFNGLVMLERINHQVTAMLNANASATTIISSKRADW